MLFLALSCVSTSSTASSFGTSQLRCEGGDPWGSSAAAFAIDTPFPTFTWANTHSAVRGATQRSFQFELREHRRSGAMPLVWNSGAVESNASTFTYPATAPALRSATTYAFNVRYTDGGGAISAWASEPSLLHFAAPDWSSVKWIGSDTTNVYRSSFQLPADPIESAVVYACGLGYAYVRVNGAAAGVEGEKRMIVTSPWSNNAKRNGYSALDVTKQLVVGAENVVAVGLGHGWRPNDPFSRHDPSWSGDTTDRVLKLQLVVTGKDGKQTIFAVTGAGTWTTAVGPSTMDSVYNGETYDASLAQVGWDAPKFVPATSWTNAAVVAGGPTGVMSAWAAPPVLIDGAPIAPINITNPYPQIFVVDFGVNQAGVSQLNDLSVFKLKKGDTITMKHAEILEHEFLPGVDAKDYEKMIYQGNLRSAKATDTYIAKGGDTGSWFPRLTYHGFRYVEVTLPVGSPSLSADQISMLHFHSAVKEKVTEASFSSPIITAIQKLAQGAQRSNLMSVPTDCDQRDERLGWMGDMALSSDSICLNFDCGAFAKSFIRAMDDEMGSDGSLPDVVPFVRFGNRPGDVSWSDAFIQTSYVLFKETGDLEMAKTYFTDFTRQIGNVVAQAKAGLDHMHTPYGDWCPPPAVAGGGQGPKPSSPYTSAVSYIHMVQQTAELAGAIGNTSEATRLSAMAASLLTDFNTAFLHNDGPPPSPTCASVDEAKTAILSCAAPGKIATVAYAGFGTLTAGCPSLAKGSCFADLSAAVRTACVGKLVCTVVCTGGEGCIVNGAAVNVTDPCYGTKKTVSVSITCSGAPPAPGPPPTPTKSYDTGMMTSVALAIEIGAANAAGSAVNSSALERLSLLMTAHTNHHTTGIIGYKVLHEALRAGGHEDQALANLENSDYPSIGYMIANEFEPATENLWELLDGFHEGNGMNRCGWTARVLMQTALFVNEPSRGRRRSAS